MGRRKLCIGAALAVLAFSGCMAQSEKAPVEITLMHGWGGTLSIHTVMQEIYDGFSAANPDINLICLPSSDSTIAVAAANDLLAVDRMPDIVSTNGLAYYGQNAVKRGKALDLMPYINADEQLFNSIHPSVIENWEEGGALYTVPDALEIMGYWYNEEYFRKAGIVNEEGQVKIPETWEEFFEACKKISQWMEKEQPSSSVFALEKEQVVEGFFLARVAGCTEGGMRMAKKDPYSYISPPVKTAFSDVKILYRYSENVNSIDNARQAFLEGKSAIYFNGVWESQILEESELASQIRYANYPTESGKSLSYISPSAGYVIAKNRDKKKEEACVRFLKYMLSEEVQMKIAMETGQAPENPNINTGKIKQKSPMLGEALERAHDADIQINAMSSLWKSSVIEELKANIYQSTQSVEEYQALMGRLAEEK